MAQQPIENEKLDFKPRILIVRGKPGSGKSTASELFMDEIENIKYINPDKISDDELTEFIQQNESKYKSGGDKKNWLYRMCFAKAINALNENREIVWDQPWSQLSGIELTYENFIEKLGRDGFSFGIAEIYSSDETSKDRVNARKTNGGHGPSENTLHYLIKGYQPIEGISLSDNQSDISIAGINGETANPQDLAVGLKQIWESL